MYAIRSYYVHPIATHLSSLFEELYQIFMLKVEEKGLRFDLILDRITSYNVCYTKLLRW